MSISVQTQEEVEVTFLVTDDSEIIAMVDRAFAERGCHIPGKKPIIQGTAGVYVYGTLPVAKADNLKTLFADDENVVLV